eukprot:CAMPEP_0173163672 /NCGR_PEP_ID=MMETSP1105-20130129/20063_1 /TAXON_ID=2985 /ORGANISM="Ochromonas sp., Strain BG-1" /LENGTH=1735 /DNA_ID=CAMNT_0014083779 /DNA_START=216 /DNA_END=5426 /DNA_ORIENTATION=-
MESINDANLLMEFVNPTEQLLDLDKDEYDAKEQKADIANDIEKKLQFYEKRYEAFLRMKQTHKSSSSSGSTKLQASNTYVKSLQRELIDSFYKLVQSIKRCENCGSFSPGFRKDGANKIFQKPLSKKNKMTMSSMKKSYKTALHALQRQEQGMETMDSDEDIFESEAEEDNNNDNTDNEGSDRENSTNKKNDKSTGEADKYLAPLEVEAQIKLLWQQHTEFLNFIWTRSLRKEKGGSSGFTSAELKSYDAWKIFFMRNVIVTPNKFRPASIVGESMSEHPQNIHLKKIIEVNSQIRVLQSSSAMDVDGSGKEFQLSKLITAWIDLQNAVNCYMDSSKDPNAGNSDFNLIGIKQILERKEGLFRRHMMGKRVNFCCRSVISPDPYLGTNEIGIPVRFAKELYYPTPVNEWNVKYLRKLVERGPEQYPGANAIETADGKIIKLEKLSAMERQGKAKLLLSTPGNKVYRHLVTGDALLVNRQPTLHKPGIMAHKARVLEHMKEQTLRMNYANCNTYNADFDGDEMNCHFLQSELARAEAYYIANTDNQYIIPTSGAPVRGLIQDHVSSAVKLTCKDTFLTKAEFQQLVYISLNGLQGTEIVLPNEDIHLPGPAILKPRPLWTGKQVISALLSHLCRAPLPPLNLDAKARTPATALGAEHNEHEVIIRCGELLSGVLDKNAIGASSLGVVHAVYECYGAELAGRLLNAFGRLFTFYLQDAGLSCGIQDLVLNEKAELERNQLLKKLEKDAEKGLENFLQENRNEFASSNDESSKKRKDVNSSHYRLASFFATDRKAAKVKIDGDMQGVVNKSASDVIKACLPNGLNLSFLNNHFSLMVLTGAKGSAVNQSQIACLLGQQALEGQRVPLMASGKSLPSFRAYDGSARAGGFVRDRFLTGVKPQEYYFHCMAGREGLVDTAVKTSRSGYLQRCLVKSLEECKVNYDMTVRDSGSNIVQFFYGEDGLDPVQAALLGGDKSHYLFITRNNQALAYKYSIHQNFFNQGIEMNTATEYHRNLAKAKELVDAAKQAPYNYDVIEKGSIVLARKKILKELPWSKENISKQWFSAEVLKVKKKEHYSYPVLDLKYVDDQSVEKKVTCVVFITSKTKKSDSLAEDDKLPLHLVKIGLPDTPMSKLKVGNSVGACSEKIQDTLVKYVKGNPDRVITPLGSQSTISADALELLVWVKYMRSLACPGEAVGCVAAQSIGEPSTQMTLNTFHLAGHGGGNVTLGIPRLREIIMTGSKVLKTPSMFIPLRSDRTMDAAKTLSRNLQQLSLIELLDHRGGVEVGEEITREDTVSRWERKYRLRLRFQPKEKMEEVFGVTFDHLISTVRTKFIQRLDWFIKLDQRRAGEGTSGKNDPLKQFRSNTNEDREMRQQARKKGKDSDDEDGDNDASEETKGNGRGGKKKGNTDDEFADDSEENTKSKKKKDYNSDEDDDSEDEEDVRGEDGDDMGNLKLQGSGKEKIGYDDDEEDDEDNAEEEDSSSDSEQGVNADTDNEESKSTTTTPKKAVKAKPSSTPAADKHTIPLHTDRFKFNEKENWIELIITYPVYNRRLLMAQIAEKAARDTKIRFTKNITNAYAISAEHSPIPNTIGVRTEGVNFEAVWDLPDTLVDYNSILSNDIWKILNTYGVEAARLSIVQEIQGVFKVYGINVNTRHLLLIADFMTRNGSYTPMNRIGMRACASPFLQMSFESTVAFLTRAAEEGMVDNHQSPSASIVLGSVPKVGTGCFDLMLPLE